jgi:hypothetical protein
MVPTILLSGRVVRSFEDLIRSLSADALASPRRSTIPLLEYWRPSCNRLDSFWHRIDCPPPEVSELHFEYEVPVRAGCGKASYTDLMIVCDEVAVGIEAKFTEPPYESVAVWLKRESTNNGQSTELEDNQVENNRRKVLIGWLRAIEQVTSRCIEPEAVGGLPYQLIHRTASVCCVERPRRYLLYQVFSDERPEYYFDLLLRWAQILGDNHELSLWVFWCRLGRSETCQHLEARWDAGERHLDEEVRKELLAGSLLEFLEPVSTRIQSE